MECLGNIQLKDRRSRASGLPKTSEGKAEIQTRLGLVSRFPDVASPGWLPRGN